jgi:hypothetical protein
MRTGTVLDRPGAAPGRGSQQDGGTARKGQALVDALSESPPAPGRRLTVRLAPVLVYLAVRGLGVAVLAVAAAVNGSSLARELRSWDAAWLLGIAADGYAGARPDLTDAFGERSAVTALGFFPGFPGTVAAVGPLTGGNLLVAAVVVSTVAGAVAGLGLARLGELVPGGSRAAGLLLAGLFAATPMAVVLSMPYTEALFCAAAAWALVGVLRGQWLLAGACTAAAGLVRPTASSLVLAVGLAALVAVVRREGGVGPWLGGVLAPAGLLGYLAYVAGRTGSPDGWSRVQREGWGWYFDGGVATAQYSWRIVRDGAPLFETATVLVLVAALPLLALAVRARLPWPLLVYGAAVVATAWGTAGLMNTKIRLLIPAFVLLVPVALWLARRRPAVAATGLATLAVASALFGAYALVIWPYAI